MSQEEDPIALNRLMWEERAELHPDSEMYRGMFERLERGGDCLLPIEKRELGDLTGRRLLHLQCHLGQDSLSLVRLGAIVTGVDFAANAVKTARRMSTALDLQAEFFEGEVLRLMDHPDLKRQAGTFDVVFASYGALCWISDLERWMVTAAFFLTSGGFLYVADNHPTSELFDETLDPASDGFRTIRPYFSRAAERWDETGSYAVPEAKTRANVSYEWRHRLGEIINAAIRAGLTIDFVNEHAEGYWSVFTGQTLRKDGLYRFPPELEGRIPLVFSLRATKA